MWSKVKIGYRTLPGTKGLKPVGAFFNNQIISYRESREFYIKYYKIAVKNRKSMMTLAEMLKNGVKIMIIGVDGPPLKLIPKNLVKLSQADIAMSWPSFEDA